MKAMTCGYVAKLKNWFLSGMGFFEGQFLPKITEKSGKYNFEAAEVTHMT